MARASIKEDLIQDIKESYDSLKKVLSELDTKKDFGFDDRDKNPRDVIAHLYEWQKMFLSWYQVGTIEGEMPAIPKEGYSWSTLGR